MNFYWRLIGSIVISVGVSQRRNTLNDDMYSMNSHPRFHRPPDYHQLVGLYGGPLERTSSVPDHCYIASNDNVSRERTPLFTVNRKCCANDDECDTNGCMWVGGHGRKESVVGNKRTTTSGNCIGSASAEADNKCKVDFQLSDNLCIVNKATSSFDALSPKLYNGGDSSTTRSRAVPAKRKRVLEGVTAIHRHCGSITSTSSLSRISILEIPVDENNVPQIDRAITPPPPPGLPTKVHGLTTDTKHQYNRRFASLRLGQCGHLHVPEDLRTVKDSGKSNSVTLATGQIGLARGNNAMHSATGGNAERLQRRLVREVPLQNIGDEISLYGTPKEEMTPNRGMSKSSTFANPNYLREQIIAVFQPSDNKLAMKLFGNKNALMKEKIRQKAVGKWVIHPCSNFR